MHKCDSIKAVNAMLRDRECALSNEAIGAVAMLAAIEVSGVTLLLSLYDNFINTDLCVEHPRQLQRTAHSYGRSTEDGASARWSTESRMGWCPSNVYIMVSHLFV